MDDVLAQPTSAPRVNASDENDANSSGDEEPALDWAKLTIQRPSIPKRGEKDFKPREGGSSLQEYNLERAREAMFNVLKSTRVISSKNVSHGIWFPDLARAHITLAKGVHFQSMGHSASRYSESERRVQKRMELLPEEALYLVERGTLLCKVGSEHGAPMSAQQAFAEMIGRDGVSLERYQVYAYLRRMGYTVTRHTAPESSPEYPLPSSYDQNPPSKQSIWSVYMHRLVAPLMTVLHKLTFNWWRPLSLRWHHSYPSLFTSLRLVPSGFTALVPYTLPAPPPDSLYKIFYNIYKPSTPYRKTAPGRPDFHCVVVNADESPIPLLSELMALFDDVPFDEPPQPRKRLHKPVPPSRPPAAPKPTFFQSLLGTQPKEREWKPHPFAVLRAGKKNVIIAAVDGGNVSFFRFGMGAFEEVPMV